MQEIGVVHQRLVHLLAVVEVREGATHERVVERRAAQIQRDALEAHRFLVHDLLLDDPVPVELLPAGLVGPDVGGINREQVELAFLEGLEGVVAVLEEPEAQRVEVGDLLESRQPAGPPVGPALQRDLEAFLEGTEAVRSRHDGKFEVLQIEILALESMPGQHLQAGERQQVLPVLLPGDKADGSVVEHFGRIEAFETDLVRPGQVLRIHHGLERPAHVLGGDRLAIAPFRPRIHVEGERLAVVGQHTALGQHRLHLQRDGMLGQQGLVELAEQLRGHDVLVEVVVEALGIGPHVDHEHSALLRKLRGKGIRGLGPSFARKYFLRMRTHPHRQNQTRQRDFLHAGQYPEIAAAWKAGNRPESAEDRPGVPVPDCQAAGGRGRVPT